MTPIKISHTSYFSSFISQNFARPPPFSLISLGSPIPFLKKPFFWHAPPPSHKNWMVLKIQVIGLVMHVQYRCVQLILYLFPQSSNEGLTTEEGVRKEASCVHGQKICQGLYYTDLILRFWTHLLELNVKPCFFLGQLPCATDRLLRLTSSANLAAEPWVCCVMGQVYSCSFSSLRVKLYFNCYTKRDNNQ